MRIIKCLSAIVICFSVLLATPDVGMAQHEARKVLWFNGMPDIQPSFTTRHRKVMADYANSFDNGRAFQITYRQRVSGGDLAAELNAAPYDIVILDLTNRRSRLNASDTKALRQFYASGRRGLMLDGSFGIRSIDINSTTKFPGKNGSSAALLINQLVSLSENGGGILIGTDHDLWQANANTALRALVPDARFSGLTNPSTDGDFIGSTLLASRVIVRASDLLKHWESVPNQGEAPVGNFTDFMGQPVVLKSLVETADKPGGGRKRAYISANFSNGEERIPIDSAGGTFENMPTHKTRP